MDTVSQFFNTWESGINEHASSSPRRHDRRNSCQGGTLSGASHVNRRKNSSTSTVSVSSSAGSGGGSVGGAMGAEPGPNNTEPTKSEPNFLSTFLTTKTANLNTQITDKLVEKFILMALPTDPGVSESNIQQRIEDAANRPQFSVQLMSKNFINMNSRLSIPFITLNSVFKVLNWENVSLNVFMLISVTNLILTPIPLISALPLFFMVYGIMLPQYVKKYSPDTLNHKQRLGLDSFPYPSYFPTRSVEEVKPCNQFSKEFFINMTDLQNFIVIYIIGWDVANNVLKKFIYFRVEPFSNFVYVMSLMFGLFNLLVFPKMVFLLLPAFKIIAIVAVWVFLIAMHPHNRALFFRYLNVERYIKEALEKEAQLHESVALQKETESQAAGSTATPESFPLQAVETNDQETHSESPSLEQEYSRLLKHGTRRKEAIKNMFNRNINIPDKDKLVSNILNFEKQFYIRFIEDEFDFKAYYHSACFDYCFNNKFDRNKCQEVQVIEIFELQSFNSVEKEWTSSIFSTDFFTKNSEIRKTFVNKLKLKRKIQLQNDHIDKSLKRQSTSSNYSLSSYLKGDDSTIIRKDDPADNLSIADPNKIITEDQTNIKPRLFCTSLELVTAPTHYKFEQLLTWTLDLRPWNWCAKNHILDVVDINDEGKWVYDLDTANKKRALEFRRRRWTRRVVRVSDYDLTYNGNDEEFFHRKLPEIKTEEAIVPKVETGSEKK